MRVSGNARSRRIGFDGKLGPFQLRDMKPELKPAIFLPMKAHRAAWGVLILIAALAGGAVGLSGAEPAWRALPLVTGGKVDAGWVQIGWGGFSVDGGALRAEPDARGLGLLVFKTERLGNCQVRVVFKTKDAKSNSGVYVRLSDGILDQVGKPGAEFDRSSGKISKESMERMKASSEREEGPWYAVHHGYEVQIADGADPFHRTGSIYSLAASAAVPKKGGEWRTMVITLAGERIAVELDGQRVASVDTGTADLPSRKQWYEPKREHKRPVGGYLGLQNHDPGDTVWFKEVSVRPLPAGVK